MDIYISRLMIVSHEAKTFGTLMHDTLIYHAVLCSY